jgi:hypothetical protein
VKFQVKHLIRGYLALCLALMLFSAWILQLLIHWLVVGGECITYGHTLGLVVGMTAVRLFLGMFFDDNENNVRIGDEE